MDEQTDADVLDMFAELPQRVKTAVLSNVIGLRSRPCLSFHDYPQHVAQYIEASGLMNVRYMQIGNDHGARFTANDQTAVLRAHLRTLLADYRIEL